jgi:type III pantothenate kinase
MNLLVDMGNTRLKWLLLDPGWLLLDPGWLLLDSAWLSMNPGATQQEGLTRYPRGTLTHGADAAMNAGQTLAADFAQQLDVAWGSLAAPKRVVIASVAAPDRLRSVQQWAAHHWPATPVHEVVAVAAQLGVTNSYREPARLGSDRWAALIGAHARRTGPLCLVDAGTALTLDALDASGVFVGGVILPGIELARRALLARAPGIAAADGDDSSCFAHSTADGVAAGTLYGAVGSVERIVTEFGLRLGKDMRVLLTGGDAPRLRPYLPARLAYDVEEVPDLVLQGLARIAESLT